MKRASAPAFSKTASETRFACSESGAFGSGTHSSTGSTYFAEAFREKAPEAANLTTVPGKLSVPKTDGAKSRAYAAR